MRRCPLLKVRRGVVAPGGGGVYAFVWRRHGIAGCATLGAAAYSRAIRLAPESCAAWCDLGVNLAFQVSPPLRAREGVPRTVTGMDRPAAREHELALQAAFPLSRPLEMWGLHLQRYVCAPPPAECPCVPKSSDDCLCVV
jgi:hypothetical protein